MNSLSVVLILFLVLFLPLALAELTYVLWYRRRFRRASSSSVPALSSHGGDLENATPSVSSRTSSTYAATPPPSKELFLYYVLYPQDARPTPASAATGSPVTAAPVLFRGVRAPPAPLASTDDNVDLEKFRATFGSRLLNSIQEGEKEGLESEKGGGRARVEAVDLWPAPTAPQPTSPPMEDEEEEEARVVRETPFHTPSSSPLFQTPVSSPLRQ